MCAPRLNVYVAERAGCCVVVAGEGENFHRWTGGCYDVSCVVRRAPRMYIVQPSEEIGNREDIGPEKERVVMCVCVHLRKMGNGASAECEGGYSIVCIRPGGSRLNGTHVT